MVLGGPLLASLVTLVWKLIALLLVAIVAYVAQALYVWKTYRDRIAKSGLPLMCAGKEFQSPLGIFPRIMRNFGQVYDYRLGMLLEMSNPPPTTWVQPTPFWNAKPMIVTVDPVVIKHFLKDNFDNYVKPTNMLNVIGQLSGQSLFGVNHGPHSQDGGAHWTLQRKTSLMVFTKNNFNTRMYGAFTRHVGVLERVMNEKLGAAPNGVLEMQSLLFQFTLDSIGEIGFGVELHSLTRDSPFTQAFDRALEITNARFMSPFWDVPGLGKLLYKAEREYPILLKTLDDFMLDIIQQKRVKMEQEGEVDKGETDLLSLFMEEKLGMTDRELRDIVFSFLLAGKDTTAATLSFSLLLLATHEKWQQILLDEIMEKRKTCQDAALPAKELKGMKQLQAFIMECLRLYPPVPNNTKEACEDDVLPGGFKIPKGARINYEPFIMARLPHIWGEDCLEFKPERWLALNTLPSPYEFPVFQAGPRICVGESMAKFEAELVLAYLVERYKFSLPPGTRAEDLTYAPGITLKVKNGLNLKVEKRE